MKNFVRLLWGVLPIWVIACASGPDMQDDVNHPAHPEAPASVESAIADTLAIETMGPHSETSAESQPHDHSGAIPDESNRVSMDDTLFACPMHPEIVRNEPGNCPICGMTLQPQSTSPDKDENHEHHSM